MLKRVMCVLMISIILSCMCACEQSDNYEENISVATTAQHKSNADNTSKQSRILIAYFTWAENSVKKENAGADAMTSASVLMPGNIGEMAAWIQEKTGGDLFSIQAENPYSADYDECLNRAADEKAKKARPKLKSNVDNIAEYDTVFIGFPNWLYTAPMAVFSFLEENNLAGKKVVLFCSHGTGGVASGVKDITAALPNSDIETNVLGIYRDEADSSRDRVLKWLAEIGY